jgi:hypothetical protein
MNTKKERKQQKSNGIVSRKSIKKGKMKLKKKSYVIIVLEIESVKSTFQHFNL